MPNSSKSNEISSGDASETRPVRNKRLGCTGEWRTEARSRAFFIFCSDRFRSAQSCLVFAKNSSSSSVRSLDFRDVDWMCEH